METTNYVNTVETIQIMDTGSQLWKLKNTSWLGNQPNGKAATKETEEEGFSCF